MLGGLPWMETCEEHCMKMLLACRLWTQLPEIKQTGDGLRASCTPFFVDMQTFWGWWQGSESPVDVHEHSPVSPKENILLFSAYHSSKKMSTYPSLPSATFGYAVPSMSSGLADVGFVAILLGFRFNPSLTHTQD
ncbi:hypothetical protein AGIG_G15662 [Arapaima gigas]